MQRRFDEMPLILHGHRVGMFSGACEIRIDGCYPTVEDFTIEDDKGRVVRFSDMETCRLFHRAILAHFASDIEDEIADLTGYNPEHRYYGRLLPSELL